MQAKLLQAHLSKMNPRASLNEAIIATLFKNFHFDGNVSKRDLIIQIIKGGGSDPASNMHTDFFPRDVEIEKRIPGQLDLLILLYLHCLI